jgi:hypothetical protein
MRQEREIFVTTVHESRMPMAVRPSVSDTPYPFLLTSPEGPDFSAFLDPNRVRSLLTR